MSRRIPGQHAGADTAGPDEELNEMNLHARGRSDSSGVKRHPGHRLTMLLSGAVKGGRHVGLQLKEALILTFVVVATTLIGGWFYFSIAENMLTHADDRHAERLAVAMSICSRQALQEDTPQAKAAIQQLAENFRASPNVRYVAILDSQGNVVGSAWKEKSDATGWSGLINLPVPVNDTSRVTKNVLVLARPIVSHALQKSDPNRDKTLLGSIRLVLDTSDSARSLLKAQQRMGIIAVAIATCALPVGYILVWRLIVQPVRRLVGVTRKLSKGDFSARASMNRNDEIGQLADAFDAMAGEVARMRNELLRANERLERKVTERTEDLRSTNARLWEEMAEKEDFLRAVSHDLNAPLRNIAGMATMVMMKWKDDIPEEVLARLGRIQANVEAETSLIGELLELSRIKSRPQRRQVVEMDKMMVELAETFEYELKDKNIAFEIHENMPRIYVEKNRLRQVFQNLIDNAIKYMDKPQGGSIRVGHESADGMHRFFVSDNGPGIPPDQHKKIFYVFRRAESSRASDIKGKGVGLALVKSVVSNYQGRAYVESQLGRGSTFYVELSARCTSCPQDGGRESSRAETVSAASPSVDDGAPGEADNTLDVGR